MTRRNAGFTLPEVAIWMALIIVMLSLSSVIVVSFLDVTRAGVKAAAGTEAQAEAFGRIGADARSASRYGIADAGARLVLTDPQGASTAYAFSAGVLYRETAPGGKQVRVPLGRFDKVEFRAAGAGAVEVVLSGSKRPTTYRFYLLAGERP